MGYYHIELSPESRLCTIVLPWGKYDRNFRWAYVTALFSRKMNELFIGMDEVRAYIDDLLLITSGTYEEHLAKLDQGASTTPRRTQR
jgi:hypothetical protein